MRRPSSSHPGVTMSASICAASSISPVRGSMIAAGQNHAKAGNANAFADFIKTVVIITR